MRRRALGNLPAEVSSFVGRRDAIAYVRRTLGDARLVTLTGPGGVGKTRLATQVARSVARAYPDGVWLVECADLREPALLVHLVVSALGITDHSSHSSEQAIRLHLANRQLLLVFDNCEHVIDACARLVLELLEAAPDVRVIATSREPLCVPGEHLCRVAPFPVAHLSDSALPGDQFRCGAAGDPEADSPSSREAVELFEQRAAAVAAGFRVDAGNEKAVEALCARLDGIPLAIELAAARVRSLTPQKMLEHLNDSYSVLTSQTRGRAVRHQTLRALVDWSYNLCSDCQRALWARAAVFPGSFDLGAAASVCGGDGQDPSLVIETILELVDKSIVARETRSGRDRYRMLETLRQYGTSKLGPAENDLVRRRHRDYFASLVEDAEAGFSAASDQKRWATALNDERTNLRSALEYSVGTDGEAAVGLRMASDLWFVWVRGAAREGSYWLDRALASEAGSKKQRGQALRVRAWMAALQGDRCNGRAAVEEAQLIAADLRDEHLAALADQAAGEVAFAGGDLATAAASFEKAIAYHRRTQKWSAVALLSLAQLGWIKGLQGNTESGARLGDECRIRSERCGNVWSLSWAYWVLGALAWTNGDRCLAEKHIRESLTIRTQIEDWLGIPFAIEILAWISQHDDPDRSAKLLGVNESLWVPIGLPLFGFAPLTAMHEQCSRKLRQALGDAAFEDAYDVGKRLSPIDSVGLALGEAATPEPLVLHAVSVLTSREREVANLVAQGMSNREVATALIISQRTAESHVQRILTKLGLNSRTQIARSVLEAEATRTSHTSDFLTPVARRWSRSSVPK